MKPWLVAAAVALFVTMAVAGLFLPKSSVPASDAVDSLEWLEAKHERPISILVLEQRGEAVPGQGQALRRGDLWNPMYEISPAGDRVVLHDIRDLWRVPDGGFLVICFEDTVSPGWDRHVFSSHPGPVDRGVEFHCMGQDWTVRFLGERFAQVSGAAFGATQAQLTVDTTERRVYGHEFLRRETWMREDRTLVDLDIRYNGTLTLHNLGSVPLVLADDLYSDLAGDPEALREAVAAEHAAADVKEGRPPRFR